MTTDALTHNAALDDDDERTSGYLTTGSAARLQVLLYLSQRPEGVRMLELHTVIEHADPRLNTAQRLAVLRSLARSKLVATESVRQGGQVLRMWYSPPARYAAKVRGQAA